MERLNIPYELVFFSEIDAAAIASYCAIHKVDADKNWGDLKLLSSQSLPDDLDLLIGGTPCQDFSTFGLNKGGDEGSQTRSSLMWYYLELIRKTTPKVIVWENVTGVLSRMHKHNYNKFYFSLLQLGYTVYGKIVNAKYFNVPQNRERIFLVAIRKDIQIAFQFPIGYDSGIRLKHILSKTCNKRYRDKNKFKQFRFITGGDTHRILKIGEIEGHKFKLNSRILSIEGISECLLAGNDKSTGCRILDDRKGLAIVRRLTPLESFRCMGFDDEDFFRCRYMYVGKGKHKKRIDYISEYELYCQAGNSMVVNVLMAILGELYHVPWQQKVYRDRLLTEKQLIQQLPLLCLNSQNKI